MITSIGSAYAVMDSQLNSLDERLRATENQVAQNNVPHVKEDIKELHKILTETHTDVKLLKCELLERCD